MSPVSAIGEVGDPMHESEVAFWARQLSEHALFFKLGLVDPALQATAGKLHAAWEAARPTITATTVLPLASDLRAFKTTLLEALGSGRWLGWIFPTFVSHTRNELDLFVARLTGAVDRKITAASWLRFMAEHAAFAAHLMDPVEAARIKNALRFVDTFQRLQQQCSDGVTATLTALSDRAGTRLDTFVIAQVAKAKSIIHPVLATHVVREGRRFLYVVDQLRRGGV